MLLFINEALGLQSARRQYPGIFTLPIRNITDEITLPLCMVFDVDYKHMHHNMFNPATIGKAVTLLMSILPVALGTVIIIIYSRTSRLQKMYHRAIHCELDGDYERAIELYDLLIKQCTNNFERNRRMVRDAKQRKEDLQDHLQFCARHRYWAPVRHLKDYPLN